MSLAIFTPESEEEATTRLLYPQKTPKSHLLPLMLTLRRSRLRPPHRPNNSMSFLIPNTARTFRRVMMIKLTTTTIRIRIRSLHKPPYIASHSFITSCNMARVVMSENTTTFSKNHAITSHFRGGNGGGCETTSPSGSISNSRFFISHSSFCFSTASTFPKPRIPVSSGFNFRSFPFANACCRFSRSKAHIAAPIRFETWNPSPMIGRDSSALAAIPNAASRNE